MGTYTVPVLVHKFKAQKIVVEGITVVIHIYKIYKAKIIGKLRGDKIGKHCK